MIDLKEEVAELEADLIIKALHETEGNVSETARRLGLKRRTLVDKMCRYGIDPDPARPPSRQTGGVSPNPKAAKPRGR